MMNLSREYSDGFDTTNTVCLTDTMDWDFTLMLMICQSEEVTIALCEVREAVTQTLTQTLTHWESTFGQTSCSYIMTVVLFSQ